MALFTFACDSFTLFGGRREDEEDEEDRKTGCPQKEGRSLLYMLVWAKYGTESGSDNYHLGVPPHLDQV